MGIDVAKLAKEIEEAASEVLEKDVSSIRGFSARQVNAIAQQAAFVAAGIANGEITDATKDFFLDSIEDMVMNFARTLRGLVTVTIEKVWNAVVAVIWRAIEGATGLSLGIA